LERAALGACLSGLLLNMPLLNRLDYARSVLRVGVDGVRAMQPGLQSNRTLKKKTASWWLSRIGDAVASLLADSLAGNTNIEVLDISYKVHMFQRS
jgi:hypothetical protein